MRQLLLLRHAKSAAGGPGLADKDRPLNDRGRQTMATMRRAMRDLGLAPDVILVSTAKRTMETLDALEPWDDTPLIEPVDTLYLAEQRALMAALQGVAETVRSVLLIGHNPGLHELALTLAGPAVVVPELSRRALDEGFPTAALAEFAVVRPWWQIDTGGTRLVRFITPRGVEAAG